MSQQNFGQISLFDATVENWTSYEERFRLFLKANGIEDGDKKQAVFLTTFGAAT